MVSVAKFGGTSVGSAEKLMYAARIIKEAAPECKYITVSAPAFEEKRMTRMLRDLADDILFYDHKIQQESKINQEKLKPINVWCDEIADGVKLKSFVLEDNLNFLYNLLVEAKKASDSLFNQPSFFNKHKKYISAIESFGERINAKFMAAALRANGLDAIDLDTWEIGLVTDSNYGNAQPLKESFQNIKERLMNLKGYIVIPGYYGYTKDGEIATFSRGGTDLTGAILAASLGADKYTIFKDDVEGVCTANPKLVHKAKTLDEITYREMREMAYLGAEVVHPDVMKLCRDNKIPIIVRGTNNLNNSGTRIVSERDLTKNPIVGITKKDGFAFFTIEQMGMNETIGYLETVLKIFKDENLSVEHITTSIDSISLCIHQSQIKDNRLRLYEKLKNTLNPDELMVSYNQALICIVGEGMNQRIGTFAEISSALAMNDINIKTVYQTPSEKNVIIGVESNDSDKAVRVLHNEFFE